VHKLFTLPIGQQGFFVGEERAPPASNYYAFIPNAPNKALNLESVYGVNSFLARKLRKRGATCTSKRKL